MEFHRLAGGVGADAGDHRDAPFGELHCKLEHAGVLLEIERGRFAGGSDGDEAVDAVLDLIFDLFAKASFIELAAAERGDHCRVCAVKHKCWFCRVRTADHSSLIENRGPRCGPYKISSSSFAVVTLMSLLNSKHSSFRERLPASRRRWRG